MRARLAAALCLSVSFIVFPAFGQWHANGDDIYNTNSGFVGIGTPSPSTLLAMNSDTSPFFLINTNGTCGSCNPSFAYTLNYSAKAYVGIAGAPDGGVAGANTGDLFFRSQNQFMRFSGDGGATQAMKIFGNHVAIGPDSIVYQDVALGVVDSTDFIIYATNNDPGNYKYGVYATVMNGFGGAAIYGNATAPSKAGYFQGDVQVTGSISKASGTFKIDDPIDPEN